MSVAKAARWLGYISFDRIVDQRNDEPVVKLWRPQIPEPYVSVDFEIYLPDADDLTPRVKVAGFTGAQPYHLVLVGEKSSLRPVLEPGQLSRVVTWHHDALVAQPDLLRGIAIDALAPFFDDTLADRVAEAREEWLADAQRAVDEQAGGDQAEALREEAIERIEHKRAELEEIIDSLRLDADVFNLPPIPEIPEAVLDDDLMPDTALCDSVWDFAEQCRRLIASKNYTNGEIGGRR
ncbi:MAG: hypothetical protein ACXV7I_15920 [Ilumatobacteraceae bacterium]